MWEACRYPGIEKGCISFCVGKITAIETYFIYIVCVCNQPLTALKVILSLQDNFPILKLRENENSSTADETFFLLRFII